MRPTYSLVRQYLEMLIYVFVAVWLSISKGHSFFMSNPSTALASKKTESYYTWLPVHVFLKDPPYQISSQDPTKHSSVINIPGARHCIKVTFSLFSLGRSQKNCADVLFFHQTRFIACLQWKALWFNTSVPSKDSSKIPYFPDFIIRSGCFTLHLLWGLLYLHWMPNQTHFLWVQL